MEVVVLRVVLEEVRSRLWRVLGGSWRSLKGMRGGRVEVGGIAEQQKEVEVLLQVVDRVPLVDGCREPD